MKTLIPALSRFAITVAVAAAINAALCTTSATAQETVQVENVRNDTVTVYWIATGCAGVKGKRTFVCHSADIRPREKHSYEFKWGTTSRGVGFDADACANASTATWPIAKSRGGKTLTQQVNSLCAIGNPNDASDEPDFFQVKNTKSEPIVVFWKARGCVGTDLGQQQVCKSEAVEAGQTARFRFSDTSYNPSFNYVSSRCHGDSSGRQFVFTSTRAAWKTDNDTQGCSAAFF